MNHVGGMTSKGGCDIKSKDGNSGLLCGLALLLLQQQRHSQKPWKMLAFAFRHKFCAQTILAQGGF